MISILKSTYLIIKRNSIYFIITLIAFLSGVILGFFFKNSTLSDLFCSTAINNYLGVISGKNSFIGYIFSNLFNCALILLVISFSGLTFFSLPIHFVIIVYQGYFLSLITPCFIEIFAFSGVVFFVITILPYYLIKMLSLCLLSTFLFDSLKKKAKCKKFDNSALILYFLIAFTLCIIAILYQILSINFIIFPINCIWI